MSESVQETLAFIVNAVASGELVGLGNGNAASGRLGALINMVEMVYDLIASGDIEGACIQLADVYNKCDGNPNPPDFAVGEAVDEVANMILVIRASFGCE